MTKPGYVYVASSWRNPIQPALCSVLTAAGIHHYDFRNPEGGTGFSWSEVREQVSEDRECHCGRLIRYTTWDEWRDLPPEPGNDYPSWRHVDTGYVTCGRLLGPGNIADPAILPKGRDWEDVQNYLQMVNHPRAIAGFDSDFAAMQKADTFVMVLPCGKSAHLELGWAIGAGKRTAILLEDPVEPELMYRMADHLATSVMDLLAWLGVKD